MCCIRVQCKDRTELQEPKPSPGCPGKNSYSPQWPRFEYALFFRVSFSPLRQETCLPNGSIQFIPPNPGQSNCKGWLVVGALEVAKLDWSHRFQTLSPFFWGLFTFFLYWSNLMLWIIAGSGIADLGQRWRPKLKTSGFWSDLSPRVSTRGATWDLGSRGTRIPVTASSFGAASQGPIWRCESKLLGTTSKHSFGCRGSLLTKVSYTNPITIRNVRFEWKKKLLNNTA